MSFLTRKRSGQPASAVPQRNDPERPPLLLLVPDATSVCALRVLSFPDADSAGDYIRFWFPGERAARLSAFWALPAQAADSETEAVVLVRHPRDQGVVYTLSFATMDEALGAVRPEIGRGLRLRDVSLYYAAPVAITMDEAGDVSLIPSTPPAFKRPVYRRTEAHLAPRETRFEFMRRRRLELHAAPFAGFGSPPGRF